MARMRSILVLITYASIFLHVSCGWNTYTSRFKQFSHIKSKTPSDVQEQAVSDLIARLIPKYASKFVIKVNSSLGPHRDLDTFEYVSDTKEGKLVITGTTGVAAALGFQHFLKYSCHAHISWSGDQLKIPEPFPVVEQPVTVTSPNRFRYYQNVCTVSYSFVWWNWTRWERELDWMAMNGINLPLAFNGQEAIWQKVYLRVGLTQQELDQHFGGPAFLAWARMGNLRGWGGPLPSSWHTNQLELQHKILDRMRAFGMTPVLPGFAGHVPEGLIRVYPKANVSRLSDWGHFNSTFCCTYLLDPSDPLFQKIGGFFIKALISEFGTDHIYNADTFNELTPRSNDTSYLSDASKAVYEGMLAGDPNATWLMQGWLFQNTSFWKPPQIKALLQGVPQGKMIVLDLYADIHPVWQRTESFYGQPFIWCMLHNFGGNIGFYGNFMKVTTGPVHAQTHKGSTMIGTGLTPEGIEQNDVVYELMNEMGWRSEAVDIPSWVKEYSYRRYGGTTNFSLNAWKLLTQSVYNCSDGHPDHVRSVIVNRPSLKMSFNLWYKPEDVWSAWDAMILTAETFNSVEPFRYDLVDVTRQSLQLIAITNYDDMIAGYKANSTSAVQAAAVKLYEVFVDMDAILSSNQYFLLGHWLNSAKALATNSQEKELYEYNARNQVTLWGPRGNIDDYANKMWGGLVNTYYKPRWELFESYLVDAISNGTEFKPDKFNAAVLDHETKWTQGTTSFPDAPVGDTLTIAKKLHGKYRPKNDQFFCCSVNI